MKREITVSTALMTDTADLETCTSELDKMGSQTRIAKIAEQGEVRNCRSKGTEREGEKKRKRRE